MTYWIFLLPIIAAVLAQAIKVVIELFHGNFSWHVLKKYGGWPSSHSALVFGLLGEMAYAESFYSAAFAVALVLTILIVRDATGYRRDLDRHATIINQIAESLPATKQIKLPHLDNTLAHTPGQIVAGAAVGLLTVIIGNLLI
ncbi:MAG: divergent PAP2 family protein [Patescibacteria group bacterium]|jgi:hypothetical protein